MKKNLMMLLASIVMASGMGFAIPKVLSDTEPGIKVNQERLKIAVKQQHDEDMQKRYKEKYDAAQEKMDEKSGPDTKKKSDGSSTENKAVAKAKASGTSERELLAKSDAFEKLDTNYLFGLSDNGLTAKESKEADMYMDSKLSGAEYIDARKQYADYVAHL